jgi:phage terminase large subunit
MLLSLFSVDQPQRVRGRKRDVLFLNECNEFGFEEYTQLALRTTYKIIIDFNPSERVSLVIYTNHRC